MKKPAAAAVLFYLAIFTAFILTGCSGGGAGGSGLSIPDPDPSVTVSAGSYTVECLTETGSFTYTPQRSLNNEDVYFIFTNYSSYDASERPAATNLVKNYTLEPINQSLQPSVKNQALRGSKVLERKSSELLASLKTLTTKHTGNSLFNIGEIQSSEYEVGESRYFQDDVAETTVLCSLRGEIELSSIPLRLEIWVQDSFWDPSNTGGTGKITQDMVDYLQDSFLLDGNNNDIYDWVTAIYGAEWGVHSFPGVLIGDDNSIAIILHDIGIDGVPVDSGSRVVGYFYPGHNYTSSYNTGSDECIRFSIDAALFAAEETWSTDNFWVEQCISTLAHEFQHMIHFYQKQVLFNVSQTDTWINELCSLEAEELVSTKLQIDGPRGVLYSDGSAGTMGNTAGRLPSYLPEASLTQWGALDDLLSYSSAYSFGAFLARNYNGVLLFRNIVQNEYTDQRAVIEALESSGYTETLESLLVKWGISTLLSDDEGGANPGVVYNTGDFLVSSSGGIDYSLGSINKYNYIYYDDTENYYRTNSGDMPFIYTPQYLIGLFPPSPKSNLFYEAGINISGTPSWDIDLPRGVRLTVVIK